MGRHLKTGRNDGIPDELYHDDSAISKHRLDHVEKSVSHYLAGSSFDSKALRIGRATHTAILEPHLLEESIEVVETSSERTKAFTSAVADNPKKMVLVKNDFDAVRKMRDSVYSHPTAAELLDFSRGSAEVSYCWQDPTHDLRCKCRVDYVGEDGTLIDLKTTREAGPAFSKSAHTFRYPHQAAWYTKGVKLSDPGIYPRRFLIVAVEKVAPYLVSVYEFDKEFLALGEREINANLDTLARYIKEPKSVWTGYPIGVQKLHKPGWL